MSAWDRAEDAKDIKWWQKALIGLMYLLIFLILLGGPMLMSHYLKK